MVRGRLGRDWRRTPFSDFLDALWADVWNDCPPLGDHAQYHEIITKLLIDGTPPHEITYKDAKGKTVTLAPGPNSAGGVALTREEGRAMMERAKALQAELQSSNDGG